jgi:hypothetical protein
MFAANTYRIRPADDHDSATLEAFAEQASQEPLTGRILIGEIGGTPAAAISLSDGRTLSGSGPWTSHLVANLRIRAAATLAHESNPSLPDRLVSALPWWYRAVATPVTSATAADEREPALATA